MASEEDVWIKICKIVTRCSLKNNLFLVPEHSGHFHLGTIVRTLCRPELWAIFTLTGLWQRSEF